MNAAVSSGDIDTVKVLVNCVTKEPEMCQAWDFQARDFTVQYCETLLSLGVLKEGKSCRVHGFRSADVALWFLRHGIVDAHSLVLEVAENAAKQRGVYADVLHDLVEQHHIPLPNDVLGICKEFECYDLKTSYSFGWIPRSPYRDGADLSVLDYLIGHGADLSAVLDGVHSNTPLLARYWVDKGVDVSHCISKIVCEWASRTSGDEISTLHFSKYKVSMSTIDVLIAATHFDLNASTALYEACQNVTAIDKVKFLIDHGADVNVACYSGDTPLHVACECFQIDSFFSGFFSGFADPRGLAKYNLALIELLISHGANVNSPGFGGIRPIHIAALLSSTELTSYLLQHGATASVLDDQSLAPLHIACYFQSLEIVKLLLDNHGLVNVPCGSKCDIMEARERLRRRHTSFGHHTPFGSSFNCSDHKTGISYQTPLHIACSKTSIEIIQLLSHFGDVNVKNVIGRTPIHDACLSGCADALRFLLDRHVDVNVCDDEGMTPLHDACTNSHKDIVMTLLQHHADVKAMTKLGQTALHFACSRSSFEIADMLIKHRADVNARQHDGTTPLLIACGAGGMKSRESACEILLGHRAHVNFIGAGDTTAFDVTCGRHSVMMVKLLLKYGADVNIADSNGHTAMHKALLNPCVDSSMQRELVDLLVKHGADVNTFVPRAEDS